MKKEKTASSAFKLAEVFQATYKGSADILRKIVVVS